MYKTTGYSVRTISGEVVLTVDGFEVVATFSGVPSVGGAVTREACPPGGDLPLVGSPWWVFFRPSPPRPIQPPQAKSARCFAPQTPSQAL